MLYAFDGASAANLKQQDASRSLTPLQFEIQKQQTRLSSSDPEERRDALMRLATLHHSDASRVAATSLNDSSINVRVAAMNAILSLPAAEIVSALAPLLKDKVPFVRQEAAYALGNSRARQAIPSLLELLTTEKDSGVRGAIVVALGKIGDEEAVVPLARLLDPALSSVKKKKVIKENEFVLRAAAHSLGELKSRAAVPALISVLNNQLAPADVRREAATALGLIADPAAGPALRSMLSESDPLLSTAAQQSLRQIDVRQNRP